MFNINLHTKFIHIFYIVVLARLGQFQCLSSEADFVRFACFDDGSARRLEARDLRTQPLILFAQPLNLIAHQEPEMRIWQIRVFGEMRIHTVNSPYFQIRPGVFGVFGSRISE